MLAEIITIGDEILIGQVVDTNSAWIAGQLNSIGIKVKQISSISDDEEHILKALEQASERANLVLITGGLGPTKDDITKKALCNYFNSKLVFNETVYQHIEELFSQRKLPMLDVNRKQAELPDNCQIIPNKLGTAAGMWFTKKDCHFISMPGVPFEMKGIVSDYLLQMLKTRFKLPVFLHRTVMTFGIGESFLAEKIREWENNLPSAIKLAYLPSPEHLRLRMSMLGDNEIEMTKILDNEEDKLNQIIGNYIFANSETSLQEVVSSMLKRCGKSLATAESCTGGNIARLITSIPGSSSFYKGSVVAYSNEIKQNVLKIPETDLLEHGAVSEAVVIRMAQEVRKLFNTDYAIASSGIAGPDGGTAEKPVGTVWIAITSQDRTLANKYVYGNNRDVNIRRASSTALDNLRRFILADLK